MSEIVDWTPCLGPGCVAPVPRGQQLCKRCENLRSPRHSMHAFAEVMAPLPGARFYGKTFDTAEEAVSDWASQQGVEDFSGKFAQDIRPVNMAVREIDWDAWDAERARWDAEAGDDGA